MPDYRVLLFKPPQQEQQALTISNVNRNQTASLSKPSISSSSTDSVSKTYTDHELERMRHCGTLFDRRTILNQEIVEEFFKKEPCLYSNYSPNSSNSH